MELSGVLSDVAYIEAGIPQGSILGPLLFNIYTASFFSHITSSKMMMYADDTQMYASFYPNNFLYSIDKLNNDINALYNISKKHSLNLNPIKSCVLLFGEKNASESLRNNIKISVGNHDIPVVLHSKNLGLVIDNSFRYRDQINTYIRNAYIQLKKIYINRKDLSLNLKKQLCETFVLSQFNFCSPYITPQLMWLPRVESKKFKIPV